MIITLPSGAAGEAKALKGRDLQALADPNLARGGRNIELMLGAVHAVTNPGPYKWEVGGPPVWGDALLGDRFAALIDIRCATWGGDYDFRVRCEECREGYDWGLDLRDLPRKPFPADTLSALREAGNAFTADLDTGDVAHFHLLRGHDEKAIEATRRANGGRWGVLDALARRIDKVVTPSGVVLEGTKLRAWLGDMDGGPLLEITDRLDAHDGGVDTTIETVCTYCQWQQEIELPFDKAFFVPKRKRAAPVPSESSGTSTG